LPLSSAGPGAPGTQRLRDRLLIPEEMKVAIAIGSVEGWSMTGRILKSVAGWPEDWALIVHERYGRTRERLRSELAQVGHLVGRRIFLSDAAPEMVDDMGSVLAGVTVGLAFYEPDYRGTYTGKNLEHLGMASGKISTYLRYGVPVILNDIGLYPGEVRRFGFGQVVESPEQIAGRLEYCSDERCGGSARSYFLEKLDFNVHAQGVWSRLREAMAAGGSPR
jgi:glycosyltransferase involved in cell wall biosynthesis